MSVIRKIFVTVMVAIGALTLYYAPIFSLMTVYYIQRHHHDQELCYIGSPKTSKEVSSMSKILHEYGESHVILCNKIFIPLRLLVDDDLLRNYTTKAGLPCPDKRFVLDKDFPDFDLWIEVKPEAQRGDGKEDGSVKE